jgi:pimeloyl-ACP methyl ester carboxylesterase
MPNGVPVCEPTFQLLANRRCFVARWVPPSAARAKVVFVPPFGDEANLSRRTMRRIAELLAPEGVDCSLLEFSGTGDSEGDLADASLAQWAAELHDFLSQPACIPTLIVAGRAGACIALEALRCTGASVDAILLWAPILDGNAILKPYLRMLSLGPKGGAESLAETRREWGAGRSVRIAGMDFGAVLVSDLQRIVSVRPPPGASTTIIELRETWDEPPSPSVSVGRVLQSWRDAGCEPAWLPARGAQFWNVPDPVDCDDLVDVVSRAVLGYLA